MLTKKRTSAANLLNIGIHLYNPTPTNTTNATKTTLLPLETRAGNAAAPMVVGEVSRLNSVVRPEGW